uniref:Immunoglobulin subtype domain-containing protein n=1 Tax=Sinocyclocheilus grahami TaxID=75366 RepID=A0A672LT57_SINGR
WVNFHFWGDFVTLLTGLTEIQNIKVIDWRFGDVRVAHINRPANLIETMDNELGRKFKGRLKLDNQTGDLTISDISTTDTGSYKVTITSELRNQITLTCKVTHYLLIYNKISELLFQICNASYFVSHVLTDNSGVAMLREIGIKCRGVVCTV